MVQNYQRADGSPQLVTFQPSLADFRLPQTRVFCTHQRADARMLLSRFRVPNEPHTAPGVHAMMRAFRTRASAVSTPLLSSSSYVGVKRPCASKWLFAAESPTDVPARRMTQPPCGRFRRKNVLKWPSGKARETALSYIVATKY